MFVVSTCFVWLFVILSLCVSCWVCCLDLLCVLWFVGAVCFCVCELSRCVFSDCLSVVIVFLRVELVTVVVCMVFMLVYS